MENISTPRAALLPRAANLATLAVVVAATWWSGAQRPAGQSVLAATGAAATMAATGPSAQRQLPVLTSTAADPLASAATIAREGLQTVGYQTRAHR